MKSTLTCRFFGLPLNYKYLLNVLIFSFVFNSKGGFTYTDTINLPVKRRRAFIKIMELSYLQLKKMMDDASKGRSSSNSRLITEKDTLFIKKMFLNEQIK